jgi:ElaB/YqjD/DUF883 family membrane-anchored ribosome-binding protein
LPVHPIGSHPTKETMTTQSTVHAATITPPAHRTTTGEASAEPRATLREMMDSGRTRVIEWKSDVQGSIRERPIQSVLVAAAVGAAVGWIFTRRAR